MESADVEGTVLDGRYRLVEPTGSYDVGRVWRAVDEAEGRTVAIMVMTAPAQENPGFVWRVTFGWAREMATIDHPDVTHIYGTGNDSQVGLYVIMEYVEAYALARTLARVGRLSPTRAMKIVAQAAAALQAVHDRGIVHRDLGPNRILLRADGTVVLSEFGLDQQLHRPAGYEPLMSRVHWTSPEEVMGHQATPRSDIYALGAIAYQCLTGRRPYEGDNPFEIAMRIAVDAAPPPPPDVPPVIGSIVERAMAKNPDHRWPTAAAFATAAKSAV